MNEPKRQIEDTVWLYILARRPLKLLGITVSAIGVLGGAIAALETPFVLLRSSIEYMIGVAPEPGAVVVERNAFVAGVLLFEAYANSNSTESKRELFDVVEGSFRAVGYQDPSLREAQTNPSDESRRIIARAADSFEGYLESRTSAGRRLFRIGKIITALQYAASGRDASGVQGLDTELRSEYAMAQHGLRYRLPRLPLLQSTQYPGSEDKYIQSVNRSREVIKSFFGITWEIDPRIDQRRLVR